MSSPSNPWCPPVDLMRAVARKLRKCPVSHLAMAQSVSWAKQFACATRSTGSSCRGRRALYAAGRRRIHIISSLCNLVHSETEKATSTPSRFVESTTVSFIATVTKPRGGGRFTLILFQSRSGYGSSPGTIANSPQRAKASRRRRMQRHRRCLQTTKRAPNWRAPFPRTLTHPRQIEARYELRSDIFRPCVLAHRAHIRPREKETLNERPVVSGNDRGDFEPGRASIWWPYIIAYDRACPLCPKRWGNRPCSLWIAEN